MNRTDLRELALLRLRDAEVLLDGGRWEAAYYLLGYVIECALKAWIAKRTQRFDFPDRKLVNESYTHDLEKLVRSAELQIELDQEMKRDPTAAIGTWSKPGRKKLAT